MSDEQLGVALPYLTPDRLQDMGFALTVGELSREQQEELYMEVVRQNATIQRLSGAVIHLQREDEQKNAILGSMAERIAELEA